MGLSALTSHGRLTLIANLTGSRQHVSLSAEKSRSVAILDASNFVDAACDLEFFNKLHPWDDLSITLDAYSVAKIIET
jgi:hypothetical protein